MSDMKYNTTSGTGGSYAASDTNLIFKNAFFASCLLSTSVNFMPAFNGGDLSVEPDSGIGTYFILDNKIDSSRSLIDMSQYQNQEATSDELVAEFASFYHSLSNRQEPLGADFESVLYENIEDLYV